MKKLKSWLGNTGATLTVMAAVLVPFVLYGAFTKAMAQRTADRMATILGGTATA